MRFLRLPVDVAIAVFFALSISVACATLAAALTHRLEAGLQAGLAALLVAVFAFGLNIKRTYWPRAPKTAEQGEPEPHMHGQTAAAAAAT